MVQDLMFHPSMLLDMSESNQFYLVVSWCLQGKEAWISLGRVQFGNAW